MSVLNDPPGDGLTQRAPYNRDKPLPAADPPANPQQNYLPDDRMLYTHTPIPVEYGYSSSPPPGFPPYLNYSLTPVQNVQYQTTAPYPEDPELRRLAIEYEDRRQALARNAPNSQSAPPANYPSISLDTSR